MAFSAGTVAPVPYHQFFDSNGVVLAGGKLFCYLAGTTTKQTTYSDGALSVPNANPIVLDSAGRAKVFLSNTSYKFVLAPSTDTDPPSSPIWTIDNVNSVPVGTPSLDIVGTLGVTVTSGQAVYQSDGSGGLNAGQWYLGDATNIYSSTGANVVGFASQNITSGTTGNIRLVGTMTGFSGLTAGALYYLSTTPGAITATPPTNARAFCAADNTTTQVVLTPGIIVDASATLRGVVNTTAQTFAGVKTWNAAPVWVAGIGAQGTFTAGTGTLAVRYEGQAFIDSAIYSSTTPGPTAASSVSLLANSLAVDGKSLLRITMGGNIAANANNKKATLTFGATATDVLPNAAYSTATRWHVVVYLLRLTSTTQRMWFQDMQGTSNTGTNTTISPAETLTGAVTISTSLTAPTSNADITQDIFLVEIVG
jgi:hypothetical protein